MSDNPTNGDKEPPTATPATPVATNSNRNTWSANCRWSEDVGDEAKLKAFLLSLFQCTVCSGYVLPPLLHCASCHFFCAICRSNSNNCCSICREPLNVRNRIMEEVAYKMQLHRYVALQEITRENGEP